MNFARRFLPCIFLFAVAGVPCTRADEQITARYSFSADNPLTHANTPGGEAGVRAVFLDWRSSSELTSTTKLSYGVGWSVFDFSRPASLAVPDKLQEISLAFGGSHRLNPRWLLLASVRPGLYGDLKGGAHEAFNVPALALATYIHSRELAWSFGLRADPLSDNSILPIAGVTWRFAPNWDFTIGFPRAGLNYAASPALKFGIGATVQGGSFHIATDPRPPAAGTRLDDTALDYREIRVGLSVDYQFNDAISLSVEGGVITDQKFEYYQRGYTLNGDAAGFFSLGLTGRF